MIKRFDDMRREVREKMRGGDKSVEIMHFMEKGDIAGNARMTAVITLVPGASIGYHVHENEDEIFYIIEGEAEYDDNGVACTLKAGDSTIVTSGNGHSIANRSDKTLKIIALIITY